MKRHLGATFVVFASAFLSRIFQDRKKDIEEDLSALGSNFFTGDKTGTAELLVLGMRPSAWFIFKTSYDKYIGG